MAWRLYISKKDFTYASINPNRSYSTAKVTRNCRVNIFLLYALNARPNIGMERTLRLRASLRSALRSEPLISRRYAAWSDHNDNKT